MAMLRPHVEGEKERKRDTFCVRKEREREKRHFDGGEGALGLDFFP